MDIQIERDEKEGGWECGERARVREREIMGREERETLSHTTYRLLVSLLSPQPPPPSSHAFEDVSV